MGSVHRKVTHNSWYSKPVAISVYVDNVSVYKSPL